MFVDCHSHLDHEQFKADIDAVILSAKAAGIKRIITNGINPETNRLSLKLAEKYDIVKAALGIYPIESLAVEAAEGEYALAIKPFDIDEEIGFIKSQKDKIIAVGEVGLDYHWVKDKDKPQKELFQKIIELAEKIKKPIIVHSRKAELDVIGMLDSSTIKHKILHCFGGKLNLAKKAADKNYIFSIPTSIARSTHFQNIAREVNINQLLTETDAPYQSPFQGQRNEPKNIIEAVKKIAEIKSFTLEETKNTIWMNYKRIFE